MTDRHAGYLVTLAENVRDDDAQDIIGAIRMVKGVLAVDPVVADPLGAIAENRARSDLTQKIWAALAKAQYCLSRTQAVNWGDDQ